MNFDSVCCAKKVKIEISNSKGKWKTDAYTQTYKINQSISNTQS